MFVKKRGENPANGEDSKLILDYLIGIAQKINSVGKDIAEVKKELAMLRDARSDKDITDGLSNIMNFDGRGKRDE